MTVLLNKGFSLPVFRLPAGTYLLVLATIWLISSLAGYGAQAASPD